MLNKCAHTCAHTHVNVHMHMQIYTYAPTCAYTHKCTHALTFHAQIYMCVHIHVHTHAHVCTHINVHTLTFSPPECLALSSSGLLEMSWDSVGDRMGQEQSSDMMASKPSCGLSATRKEWSAEGVGPRARG